MTLKWKAKKGFSIILLVMMMMQMLPMTLLAAIADEVIVPFVDPPVYHTVKFEDADGIVIKTTLVAHNYPVDAGDIPADPVKTTGGATWIFLGWAGYDPNSTDEANPYSNSIIDCVTMDTVFKPLYEKVPDGGISHHPDRLTCPTQSAQYHPSHLIEFRMFPSDDFIGTLGGSNQQSYSGTNKAWGVFPSEKLVWIDLAEGQHYYIKGWQVADGSLPMNVFPPRVSECWLFYAYFGYQLGLTLIAKSDTQVYDGQPHSVTDFYIYDEYGILRNDLTIEGVPTTGATLTNVGTLGNDFTMSAKEIEKQLRDLDEGTVRIYQSGIDVTEKYWCKEVVNGQLKITPRPITVNPVTESKNYTGFFIFGNYIVSSGTLGAGDSITGSAFIYNQGTTNIGGGITPGDYPMVIDQAKFLAALANSGNYSITYGEGTLTILNTLGAKIPIVVQPKDETKVYNGFKQNATTPVPDGSAFVVGDTKGLQVRNVQVFGEGQFVGTYPLNITNIGSVEIWQKKDPSLADSVASNWVNVTHLYNVSTQRGDFIIRQPGSVGEEVVYTIELVNDTDMYDGNEKVLQITNGVVTLNGTPTGMPAAKITHINGIPVPADVTYIITLDAIAKGTNTGTYQLSVPTNVTITADGTTISSYAYAKYNWVYGNLKIVAGDLRPLTLKAKEWYGPYTGLTQNISQTITITSSEAASSPYIIGYGATATDDGFLVPGYSITFTSKGSGRLPINDPYGMVIDPDSIIIKKESSGEVIDKSAWSTWYNFDYLKNSFQILHRDDPIFNNAYAPLPLYVMAGNYPDQPFTGFPQQYDVDVSVNPAGAHPSEATLVLGNGTNAGTTGSRTWIGSYDTNVKAASWTNFTLTDAGSSMNLSQTNANGTGDYYFVNPEKVGVFKIVSNQGILTEDQKPKLNLTPGSVTMPYTSGTVTVTEATAGLASPTITAPGGASIPTWVVDGFKASGSGVIPNSGPSGSYPAAYDIIANLTGLSLVYNGVDYSKEYAISTPPGKLTIRPRTTADGLLPLTATGNTVEKNYDGSIHRVTHTTPDFTITIAGWPGIMVQTSRAVTGITAAGQGSAPATYDVPLNVSAAKVSHDGYDVSTSYTIAPVKGYLKVNPVTLGSLPFNLSSGPQREYYTGAMITENWAQNLGAPKTITAPVYPAAGSVPESGSFTATASAQGHVPDTTIGYQSYLDTITIKTVEGVDVTQYYNIAGYKKATAVPAMIANLGKLFIDPVLPGAEKSLNVVLNNKSTPYTGYPITVNDAIFNGVPLTTSYDHPNNETVTITTSGSGLVPKADYPITMNPTGWTVTIVDLISGQTVDVSKNYTLVPTNGKLAITPLADPNLINITFKANDLFDLYQGGIPVPFAANNVVNPGAGKQLLGVPGDTTQDLEASGFVITLSTTGSASELGITAGANHITDGSVKITYNGTDVTNNYKIAREPGDIELINRGQYNEYEIVLNSSPVSTPYTGKQIDVVQTLGSGITVTNTTGPAFNPAFTIYVKNDAAGNSLTPVTATATGTAPNGNGVPIDWTAPFGYVIKDGSGRDITASYSVTENFAPFKILPLTTDAEKIKVTFKPEDDLDTKLFINDWVSSTTNLKEYTTTHFSDPLVKATYVGTGTGKAWIPGKNYSIVQDGNAKIYVDGEDVTDNYKISYEPGTLRILDKVYELPINLKGRNDTVPYTGNLITRQTAIDTDILNVKTDTLTTGSGITVGTYPLVIPNVVVLQITDDGTNYVNADKWFKIDQKTNGVLEITPLVNEADKILVTLTPDNATHKFTGSEVVIDLTLNAYAGADAEFTGKKIISSHTLTPYETLTANATGKGITTDPAGYPITVYQVGTPLGPQMMVAPNADGSGTPEDMTDNYKFVYNIGKLTITTLPNGQKLPLTVQAPSYTAPFTNVPYDNIQLTEADFPIIHVDGQLPMNTDISSMTYQATGKFRPALDYPTLIGHYADEIVLIPGSVKIMLDGIDLAPNYDIKLVPNDMDIIKMPAKLQITVSDVVKPFTSKAIEVDKTEVTLSMKVIDGPASFWDDTKYTIEFGDLLQKGNAYVPDTYDEWLSFLTTPESGFKALDENGNQFDTEWFSEYIVVPGKLTVTPLDGTAGNEKLAITLKPQDGTENYTGFPIDFTTTVHTVEAGDENVSAPGRIDTHAWATQTNIGVYTDEVVFDSIKILYPNQNGVDTDVAANYEITPLTNDFTINGLAPGNRIPIIVTADDVTVPFRPAGYYGAANPETHVGVTAKHQNGSVLPATLTYTGTVSYGEGLVPGVAYDTKTVQSTFQIQNGGVDVTDQYNVVRYVDGVMNITPVDPGDPAKQPFAITIQPDDKSLVYNGNLQVQPVTQGTVTFDDGTPMLPVTEFVVDFNAEGRGTIPDTYPINLLLNGAAYDAIVKQFDKVRNVWADLTNQYAISEIPGVLTITPGNISITVKPEPQKELIYNGASQGTYELLQETGVNGYKGITPNQPGLDILIEIKGNVEGINAGDYPIPVDPADVVIYGRDMNGQWVDVTTNFAITTEDGTFKIKPRVLQGTITAPDDTTGPHEYGDVVNPPAPDYTLVNFPDPDFAVVPGDTIGAGGNLDWTIIHHGPNPDDAGQHEFVPEIVSNDPNYDTSQLVLNPSNPYFISKAGLKVIPSNTRRAQRDPNPNPFMLEMADPTQRKFADTIDTIGLMGYDYQSTVGPAPIGSWHPINYVNGPASVANYDITYLNNDAPDNGMLVYGQVWLHANYLNGTDKLVIRPEEYDTPTATTIAGTARSNGLAMDWYQFDGWTTDPDGTKPYVEGSPIGDDTLDLYAQWTQLYRLEVSHRLTNGTEIANPQIFWLEENVNYQFSPIVAPNLTAKSVSYVVNGETFVTGPTGFIKMPGEEISAVIEYELLDDQGNVITDLGKKLDGDDTDGLYFGIGSDFIPLNGIGAHNIGITFQ